MGKVKGLEKIAILNGMFMSNVLLVESLNFNLLSVAQLCDLGFKFIFRVDDMEIVSVDGSNLVFKGFKDVQFEKGILCSSYQAEKQVINTHLNKSMACTG